MDKSNNIKQPILYRFSKKNENPMQDIINKGLRRKDKYMDKVYSYMDYYDSIIDNTIYNVVFVKINLCNISEENEALKTHFAMTLSNITTLDDILDKLYVLIYSSKNGIELDFNDRHIYDNQIKSISKKGIFKYLLNSKQKHDLYLTRKNRNEYIHSGIFPIKFNNHDLIEVKESSLSIRVYGMEYQKKMILDNFKKIIQDIESDFETLCKKQLELYNYYVKT